MSMDKMLAYSEVDEILNLLDNEYASKIPEKIRDFLKDEKMPEYKPKIDLDIPLEQQNLKRETIILLAVLKLNYWCENETEKQNFLEELANNEREKKELEEKYNPDNLFKKEQREMNKETEEEMLSGGKNVQITEYKKQNFFRKILREIMKILKRNR